MLQQLKWRLKKQKTITNTKNLRRMKTMFNAVLIGSILAGAIVVLSAFTSADVAKCQAGSWVVPASANSLKNPLIGNESSTSKGKKLYKQMCAICHGDSGKGDGVAGASLNPRPANFTTVAVQSQTDGAIFWKMSEGKAPMAAYKEFLSETERWELVNYIRTLKK